MKQNLLYIVFSFICVCSTYSQNKIKLQILSVETTDKENFILKYRILNSSCDKTTIYIPVKEDICYSLISVSFLSSLETRSTLFPCSELFHIDLVDLKNYNSITLDSGEVYESFLLFNLLEISPFLQKGIQYEIRMELNFKGVNFKNSDFDIVFSEDLESNLIIFKF